MIRNREMKSVYIEFAQQQEGEFTMINDDFVAVITKFQWFSDLIGLSFSGHYSLYLLDETLLII